MTERCVCALPPAGTPAPVPAPPGPAPAPRTVPPAPVGISSAQILIKFALLTCFSFYSLKAKSKCLENIQHMDKRGRCDTK